MRMLFAVGETPVIENRFSQILHEKLKLVLIKDKKFFHLKEEGGRLH